MQFSKHGLLCQMVQGLSLLCPYVNYRNKTKAVILRRFEKKKESYLDLDDAYPHARVCLLVI